MYFYLPIESALVLSTQQTFIHTFLIIIEAKTFPYLSSFLKWHVYETQTLLNMILKYTSDLPGLSEYKLILLQIFAIILF